jgi:hypothetical protein
MRVLLAVAIAVVLGGTPGPGPSAVAGPKPKYARAKPPCYAPRRAWTPPCRAWRYRPPWPYSSNDPTGEFRGFPNWAARAFSEPRN